MNPLPKPIADKIEAEWPDKPDNELANYYASVSRSDALKGAQIALEHVIDDLNKLLHLCQDPHGNCREFREDVIQSVQQLLTAFTNQSTTA